MEPDAEVLSRTVLTAVAGGPFKDSLNSAFDKLYDALPPSMWIWRTSGAAGPLTAAG